MNFYSAVVSCSMALRFFTGGLRVKVKLEHLYKLHLEGLGLWILVDGSGVRKDHL